MLETSPWFQRETTIFLQDICMSQVFRYWNSFILPSRTGLTLTTIPYLLQFFNTFWFYIFTKPFWNYLQKGRSPLISQGSQPKNRWSLIRQVSLYVAGALSWWKSSRPLCSTTWLSYLRGQPHRDKGVVFCVNREPLRFAWNLIFPFQKSMCIWYII